MFDSIMRLARQEVEDTVGSLVERTLVVVPFLVAGALLTAAGTVKLMRELGTELGLTAMAAIFVIIGAALAATLRRPALMGVEEDADEATFTSTGNEPPHSGKATAAEQELVTAAFTALAPVAAPALVRIVLKNLPILAAIAAALFVFTRPVGAESAESAAGVTSAE